MRCDILLILNLHASVTIPMLAATRRGLESFGEAIDERRYFACAHASTSQ
jgi:hypothetical protein